MIKAGNTDEGTLAETLNAIITDLHEAAKTGAELAGKELSLLAEEVVMYGAIVASGWILASLILLGIAWKFYSVTKKLRQKREKMLKESDDDVSDVNCNIFVVSLGIVWTTAIGGVLLLVNSVALAKTLLAPRLYLLEYVATLVK